MEPNQNTPIAKESSIPPVVPAVPNTPPAPTTWTSRLVIVLVVVGFVGLYALGHFVYYGSLTRNCIYTEKEVLVPEALLQGELVTTQKAYVLEGLESKEQSCSPHEAEISRQLLGPESSLGYYAQNGNTVRAIGVGESFRVVGAFSQEKHGISTIDSGGGPYDILILQDTHGTTYTLPVVMSHGTNDSGDFLKFVSLDYSGMITFETFLDAQHSQNQLMVVGAFQIGEHSTTKEDSNVVTDYTDLLKNCDSDCCRQSVQTMQERGYQLFRGTCPSGEKSNREMCIQSVTWCEPVVPVFARDGYANREMCESATSLGCIYVDSCIPAPGSVECPSNLHRWVPLEKSYYDSLENTCRRGDECCTSSVAAMREKKASLEPKDGCGAGTAVGMMKCPTSRRWCQSTTTSAE